MKPKLLFLFPEGNLFYSPTTINLIKSLNGAFNISVIVNETSKENILNDLDFIFIPLKTNKIKSKYSRFRVSVVKRLKMLFQINKHFDLPTDDTYLFIEIKKIIKEINPFKVIAIDFFALRCCELLDQKCIFLSYEIPSKSIYSNSLTYEGIQFVIIQSLERYHFLFGNLKYKPEYFILPNAPIFNYPSKRTVPSKKLIYNGFIWSAFGVQFCLNLVSKYTDYHLNLKGAVHSEQLVKIYFPHLLNYPNVTIETSYLKQDELIDYLRNFSIGFCFYHFDHPFIKENDFNYETGPSGKLHTYLSIGLPVICSNIKAFEKVAEFNAGILLNDFSPEALRNAVDLILDNYAYYSENALKLAEESCFQKKFIPIFNHLITTSS